jgi:acyl phosphate:glycerol-3-phosphate acyltransferase
MTVFPGMLLLAYLAGSINFAILLMRWAGKGDPRTAFSGNAGVTNVFRSTGWHWAALILLLDVGRAILLAWISLRFLPLPLVPWVGFGLVLGNGFPCFHGFRGGKGVAAYLGFSILLAPWAAFLSALLWVAVFRRVRIPFVASFVMIPILAAGVLMRCNGSAESLWATLATVALILIRHRKNISALIKTSPVNRILHFLSILWQIQS